ncbi:hypothetical protein PRIPAC_70371 [Pristionchus pacificus]|uniref:Uncharacterized protein n=1 Tax=Pristionchus pacificus TaxID=54126 RepID=A0A2A6C0S1_PRIPA|nr:hypothetical protein PRIPAC_70371 [Pristionchus pacificus]|eukprot:PDM71687.1 hypothetical protein PRIPAC_38094 [Pristionchus pacificus]
MTMTSSMITALVLVIILGITRPLIEVNHQLPRNFKVVISDSIIYKFVAFCCVFLIFKKSPAALLIGLVMLVYWSGPLGFRYVRDILPREREDVVITAIVFFFIRRDVVHELSLAEPEQVYGAVGPMGLPLAPRPYQPASTDKKA